MSIAAQVEEALRRLRERNYESAMIAACIALDATAKKTRSNDKKKARSSDKKDTRSSNEVGDRIRKFVNDNLDIITVVGLAGAILAAPGSTLRLNTPGSSQSSTPLSELEDIIYKKLRCNLVHEASLPQNVEFTEQAFYGEKDGRFYIPVLMIYALLLAIIGTSCNTGCRLSGDWRIQILGQEMTVNTLWGKADCIREQLGLTPRHGSQ